LSLKSSLGKIAHVGGNSYVSKPTKPTTSEIVDGIQVEGYDPKPLREGQSEDWSKPVLRENDPTPGSSDADPMLPFLRALHSYPVGFKATGTNPKNTLRLLRAAEIYNELKKRRVFQISKSKGYIVRVLK